MDEQEGRIISSTLDPYSINMDAGAFETTDNGTHWSRLPFANSSLIMAFSRNIRGVYLAGSYQTELFRRVGPNGSWEQVPLYVPGNSIRGIASNSKGTFFVVGDAGVFVSSDDGVSWTQSDSGMSPGYLGGGAIAINSLDHLFVSTGGIGIYRSTNYGQSWVVSDSGVPNTFIYALLPLSPTRILLAAGPGVYESLDNGTSWHPLGSLDAVVLSIVADGQGNLFAAADLGLYTMSSTDLNWKLLSQEHKITLLGTRSNGAVIGGTRYNGLLQSEDKGLTWKTIGLPVGKVTGLATSPEGDIYAAERSSGVSKYMPTQNEWNHLFLAYSYSLGIGPTGDIFVGRNTATVQSTDGGLNWRYSWFTDFSVVSIVFDEDGSVIVGTNGDGAYRSSDRGLTWERAGLLGSQVRSLVRDSIHVFLAGTNNGLYRTSNRGDSWEPITGYDITAVLVSNTSILMGTRVYGIIRSDTTRTQWLSSNNGLSSLEVNDLLMDQRGDIYAATPVGVFRSTNKGNLWLDISDGLPSLPLLKLVEDKNGNLFVATEGGGCYVLKNR